MLTFMWLYQFTFLSAMYKVSMYPFPQHPYLLLSFVLIATNWSEVGCHHSFDEPSCNG